MGVVFIGLLEAGAFLFLMFRSVAEKRNAAKAVVTDLENKVTEKTKLRDHTLRAFSQMIDAGTIRAKVDELRKAEGSLRAERGRITITQAELDAVEARLRELEEIERELEASSIETKEELAILERKTTDLRERKEKIEGKLQEASGQIDQLIQEIELSAQVQEQLEKMKAELLMTQSSVDKLLLQIEEGNNQYFSLKRRYDALDIEYAQLYEKFAEAEALLSS